MPTISRPLGFFIAVSVVGIGIYMYTSAQSDAGSGMKLAATKSKAADKPSDYTDEDYGASFDAPAKDLPIHNVFMPLVRNEGAAGAGGVASADDQKAKLDSMRIPAAIAGGDPNWIFTGYAVINGERSALLENRSTHHSDFVTEGAAWKASRLLRIQGESVVFDDLAGGQAIVTRFDSALATKSDAKPAPDATLKPLDVTPMMQGPIGQPQGPGGPGRRRVMNNVMPGNISIVNGTVSISAGD